MAAHDDFHPEILPNFVRVRVGLQLGLQHSKVSMTDKKSVRSNLVDQLIIAEKLIDETQHELTRDGVAQ